MKKWLIIIALVLIGFFVIGVATTSEQPATPEDFVDGNPEAASEYPDENEGTNAYCQALLSCELVVEETGTYSLSGASLNNSGGVASYCQLVEFRITRNGEPTGISTEGACVEPITVDLEEGDVITIKGSDLVYIELIKE